MLKHVPGLAPLPTAKHCEENKLSIKLNDIQGDILVGMHKHKQIFYFFAIEHAARFKTHLSHDLAPIVASVKQLMDVTVQPLVALNIAFSRKGLDVLGVQDNLGDSLFHDGQIVNTEDLLGEKTDTWVPEFKKGNIHGVILLASDTTKLIHEQVEWIEETFGTSIKKVYTLDASIRPGAEEGHEMFGFLDGIAQPAIKGFGEHLPGQLVVDEGVILTGGENDTVKRPGWMTGGSFLAFRQLEQLVPEFNKFLLDHAPDVPHKSHQERADLLGARMVGRWKSGAPIDLSPHQDDPKLGADPERNNHFDFSHPGINIASDQSRCPFSAHIRKTRPRADLSAPANSIIRSGIPYGPEVSHAENTTHATEHQRGLAFVSYQAQIGKGFQFLQKSWANNVDFVIGKKDLKGNTLAPGFDPIIGQNNGEAREAVGLDPAKPTGTLTLPFQFVVSRGGEYFFSPPISALRGKLAK